MESHWPNGGGHVTVFKDFTSNTFVLGHLGLIKNKKQTALINVVSFRIFSYASQDTLSKVIKST